MPIPQSPGSDSKAKPVGFFAIFPILAKLAWRYGKRLFSVDTIVALEKKQGAGSGERTVEEELLAQAMERNPHQYHVPAARSQFGDEASRGSGAMDYPVLVVRKGDRDERRS